MQFCLYIVKQHSLEASYLSLEFSNTLFS